MKIHAAVTASIAGQTPIQNKCRQLNLTNWRSQTEIKRKHMRTIKFIRKHAARNQPFDVISWGRSYGEAFRSTAPETTFHEFLIFDSIFRNHLSNSRLMAINGTVEPPLKRSHHQSGSLCSRHKQEASLGEAKFIRKFRTLCSWLPSSAAIRYSIYARISQNN